MRPFDRRGLAQVASLLLAFSLAGCTESIFGYNGVNSQRSLSSPPPVATAPGLGAYDLAVPPNVSAQQGNGNYGQQGYSRSRGMVYPGVPPTATMANQDPATTNNQDPPQTDTIIGDATGANVEAKADGSYQLNFENADIAAVAKVIFGDILKTNYILDPRVSGQINLASSAPIPRSRLVPLFEAALLSANASIVKEDGAYRITPTADPGGLRSAQYDTVGEGYGVTVIGSKYISAASIAHLLEEYGSRAGTVKLDPGANLVMVQGTAAERQAALSAASMLDVDWLRSKSVAILPLKNATPEQVIPEINRILDTGKGGFSEDMVQMQPLGGLNAILAVARSRELINKVVIWAQRLDQQDYAAFSLQAYHLQYAQAKAVASVLNSMFGGGSGGAGQSDKDQLAPGGQNNSSTSALASLPTAFGGSSSGTSGTSSGIGGTSGGLGGSSLTGGSSGLPGSSSSMPGSSSGSSSGSQSNPFGALKTDETSQSGGGGGTTTSPNGTKVHVTADIPSNTLFIYSDKQTYAKIERAIHDIDRPPTQVDIDVTIAEVTLNKDLQYGVQAYLNNGTGALSQLNGSPGLNNSSSTGTGTGTGTGVGTGGIATSFQPGIPLSMVNPGVNLLVGNVANPRVLINALSTITDVKVLSSPSLVVADRQPAQLEVGDQVPVLSQTAVSTETIGAPVVNSVDYVNTGIILNVLPSVNANGIVSLQIQQEISSVTNPGTAANPNLTPTISQRTVHSTVSVPSGQTVLLAGLIQDQRSETRSGLPGMGDIPVLNQLLTSHDSNVQRDELIIFIRPRILHNAYDAEAVSEEFRQRLQSMQPQLVEPAMLRKP